MIRPTLPCTLFPVNHMFPSGPAAMYHGFRIETNPLEYSVLSPSVVIRPTRPGAVDSVNQSAPSGPAVMPCGSLAAVGTGTSVIAGALAADAGTASTTRQARRA